MSKKAEAIQHVDIVERFNAGEFLESAHVDRKDNRIRDVKLCGKHSKNGRIYTDRALEDGARLYEGAPFYLDHPTEHELRARRGVRSVLDLAGKIENARKVGDAVRGDIVLLDKQPSKDLVLAIAEQMPKLAGNSHRATGTVRRENGTDIVEGLDDVMGVELVTDPATSSGLFESVTSNEDDDMDKLTLDKLKQERPDLVEAVLAASNQATEFAELKKTNEALEKKLDEATARDRLKGHKEMIAEKLKEAKLPKAVVTEFFEKQLEHAEDEKAVDAMIADRANLGPGKRTTPTSHERNVDESGDRGDTGDITEIDESKLGAYASALGVA